VRSGRAFLLLGILGIALATRTAGQEPILDLSIAPVTVHLPAGGEAHLRLTAKNSSVHEADGLTASLAAPDRFTIATEPETLKVIEPFSTGTIDILLRSAKDTPEENYNGKLAIVYTYCIGELCFQIADALDFQIVVEPASEAVQTPSVIAPVARGVIPWPWIGFGAGLVILGAALLGVRRGGVKWHVYLILSLLSSASLGYGVATYQHEQAQGIGAILCTSCVGIEEAGAAEASLSEAGIAQIEGIEGERDLIVFYAPWCHACPFAEAMVEQAAEHNPAISYRSVDVEKAPELAAQYGIIRSGRTIVPAILRVDTGKVIFGIENLEERLIEMLKEGGWG